MGKRSFLGWIGEAGRTAGPTRVGPNQTAGANQHLQCDGCLSCHSRRGQDRTATLRKYRTFIKQLREFADARGYVMLDRFTSADIDVFYATLALGARAKGKR